MLCMQSLMTDVTNSIRSNNPQGFRTRNLEVMKRHVPELLADLTIERKLKISDEAVDILEVCPNTNSISLYLGVSLQRSTLYMSSHDVHATWFWRPDR